MGHYDDLIEADREKQRLADIELKRKDPRTFYQMERNYCELVDLILELKYRVERLESAQQ